MENSVFLTVRHIQSSSKHGKLLEEARDGLAGAREDKEEFRQQLEQTQNVVYDKEERIDGLVHASGRKEMEMADAKRKHAEDLAEMQLLVNRLNESLTGKDSAMTALSREHTKSLLEKDNHISTLRRELQERDTKLGGKDTELDAVRTAQTELIGENEALKSNIFLREQEMCLLEAKLEDTQASIDELSDLTGDTQTRDPEANLTSVDTQSTIEEDLPRHSESLPSQPSDVSTVLYDTSSKDDMVSMPYVDFVAPFDWKSVLGSNVRR